MLLIYSATCWPLYCCAHTHSFLNPPCISSCRTCQTKQWGPLRRFEGKQARCDLLLYRTQSPSCECQVYQECQWRIALAGVLSSVLRERTCNQTWRPKSTCTCWRNWTTTGMVKKPWSSAICASKILFVVKSMSRDLTTKDIEKYARPARS